MVGQAVQAPDTPQAPTFLRLSAGTVYFFFGYLKFFPDLSPAELLAGQAIMEVTWHHVGAQTALWWLAVFECAIGLSFLFNVFLRWLFILFLIHQLSTFLPLFVFPELTFKFVPFAPTMEGQYIFKNLISLAAGWTVMYPAVKASFSEARDKGVPPNQPANGSGNHHQPAVVGAADVRAARSPENTVEQARRTAPSPRTRSEDRSELWRGA